jgi:hypothetical protein
VGNIEFVVAFLDMIRSFPWHPLLGPSPAALRKAYQFQGRRGFT